MKKRVRLFIPCLVDQLYPEIGASLVSILTHFGYEPTYNDEALCCGQPAFNAGHHHEAKKVGLNFIHAQAGEEPLVCPSGSCTAMVKNFYPELFEAERDLNEASSVATRLSEFSQFLASEGLIPKIIGSYSGRVGFHNSCHSARELHVAGQPVDIMRRITGYELIETEPVCCGFGGLFCIKFDAIAASMAKTRLEMFSEKGVDTIVSNDPGCIMHLNKECERKEIPIRIMHLAQFISAAMKLPSPFTAGA